MIEADLKRKTHAPEDIFTSNCIGILALTDDKNIIEFFSMAEDRDRNRLDLLDYTTVDSIEFWPRLPGRGEPDVMCVITNNDNTERIVLVIEVKLGAGKSGSGGDASQSEGETSYSNDQLAKYWQAANDKYKDDLVKVKVLYLTHNRDFPAQDIEDSVRETGGEAEIYWNSWYHFHQFITDKSKNKKCSQVESKIFRKLKFYLEQKGYRTFQGWELPVTAISHLYYHPGQP